MKRHGKCAIALAGTIFLGPAAYAAEGASAGNGTSTPAGPASDANSNKMGGDKSGESGRSTSAPSKSANPGSQGESNGTATPAGPANK